MAGTYSNEPYQRVSQDNGVFDGALIGMAIGGGGAGAGVFGARMNYNGIERRTQQSLNRMEAGMDQLVNRESKALDKYDAKIDRIVDRERTYNSNTRSGMSSARATNRYNQRKVERPLDKLDSAHQKNLSKINREFENIANAYDEISQPSYLSNKQASHLYSRRMGGWKNAAIIGASAVVGGGLGMLTDGMNN